MPQRHDMGGAAPQERSTSPGSFAKNIIREHKRSECWDDAGYVSCLRPSALAWAWSRIILMIGDGSEGCQSRRASSGS
jgi:hypothetical protein